MNKSKLTVFNNVGAFRNFPNDGSIQFEETDFIYGTKYKSEDNVNRYTFFTKEKNEPSLITSRKSIPAVKFKSECKNNQ